MMRAKKLWCLREFEAMPVFAIWISNFSPRGHIDIALDLRNLRDRYIDAEDHGLMMQPCRCPNAMRDIFAPIFLTLILRDTPALSFYAAAYFAAPVADTDY